MIFRCCFGLKCGRKLKYKLKITKTCVIINRYSRVLLPFFDRTVFFSEKQYENGAKKVFRMRFNGFCEYTKKCRAEGGLLARIIFLCVLYGLFGIVTVYVSMMLSSAAVFFILALVSVSVVFITKPFFVEQRDYEIVDGSFRIYKVYGKALSRKAFELELRSMERIAPYTSSKDIPDGCKTKDFLSDGRSDDAYFALYLQNGERCAVIFDGDEKFYAAASVYASRAFEKKR